MFFPLMHSPPANQVPLSYGPAGSLAERHELRASMIAFCMIIDRSKIETASHTEVEREESYRKIHTCSLCDKAQCMKSMTMSIAVELGTPQKLPANSRVVIPETNRELASLPRQLLLLEL
ncbi:uncharacterized protein LOC143426198 isoform X1 [Xylocopa sonorina]|uniref:uncharacterized protein LOC143426198 isoform X1 n=1 Tax=Xylocopa sonorina TaxID=1818115 RepID=UPI00403AEDF3